MEPVEIWASMIHQEGKQAALEIADSAGAEAALDAMEYLRAKYEAQMVRYRDALKAVRDMREDRVPAFIDEVLGDAR